MPTRVRRALTCATAVVACVATAQPALPTATAASALEVSYSDRNVVAGATVRAVVDKSSRPAGTTLVLQRSYLDKWRTADASAEDTRRGYVFEVPTDQFGQFSYRVVARADKHSVVARSGATTVRVRPPYDPPGRPTQHSFSDEPRIRWNSCGTIRWVFNPANSPKGALRQVREGVHRIHLATGLDFSYAGRTRQKANPYGDNLDGAHVIIGWRTAADFRPFSTRPGTVGLGGNKYYDGYQEADGARVSRAFRGGVVLNASMRGELSNGFGRGTTWGEAIIHELGHVVGLTHVSARSQIMHFPMQPRNANWGAGDLAGFRRLGDVRGCLRRVSARQAPAPANPGRFLSR